jgi:hypothetical protein
MLLAAIKLRKPRRNCQTAKPIPKIHVGIRWMQIYSVYRSLEVQAGQKIECRDSVNAAVLQPEGGVLMRYLVFRGGDCQNYVAYPTLHLKSGYFGAIHMGRTYSSSRVVDGEQKANPATSPSNESNLVSVILPDHDGLVTQHCRIQGPRSNHGLVGFPTTRMACHWGSFDTKHLLS